MKTLEENIDLELEKVVFLCNAEEGNELVPEIRTAI